MKEIINQILNVTKNVSARSKKNNMYIFFDILVCMAKYGASPNNYDKFEFEKLSSTQRKTYVTNMLSNKMIKKLNDNNYRSIFENKLEFARKFNKFFGREYISSKAEEDALINFFKNNKKVIYKPLYDAQANGIKVYNLENYENLDELYTEINKLDEGIIEAWIEQDEVINEIYPNAVNCLRIITVYDGNKANLITGGITFAVNGEIANGCKKSLIAPINMETGVLEKSAATFGSDLYENHPITNKRIKGVKVPYWNEIKEMLSEAVKVVPQVKYVGWDIAITKNGPCLIEGNTSPGYRYYQIPLHLDNGIGNRQKYEKFLRK